MATLPAILPTCLTAGINFLVNQLLAAGAGTGVGTGAEREDAARGAGLLKFNKQTLLAACA